MRQLFKDVILLSLAGAVFGVEVAARALDGFSNETSKEGLRYD